MSESKLEVVSTLARESIMNSPSVGLKALLASVENLAMKVQELERKLPAPKKNKSKL